MRDLTGGIDGAGAPRSTQRKTPRRTASGGAPQSPDRGRYRAKKISYYRYLRALLAASFQSVEKPPGRGEPEQEEHPKPPRGCARLGEGVALLFELDDAALERVDAVSERADARRGRRIVTRLRFR